MKCCRRQVIQIITKDGFVSDFSFKYKQDGNSQNVLGTTNGAQVTYCKSLNPRKTNYCLLDNWLTTQIIGVKRVSFLKVWLTKESVKMDDLGNGHL